MRDKRVNTRRRHRQIERLDTCASGRSATVPYYHYNRFDEQLREREALFIMRSGTSGLKRNELYNQISEVMHGFFFSENHPA